MNKLLKRITAIMLTIALVSMVGCKKADEPSNGDNNGNNGGNGGETPEMPAIVSSSEVQYDGKVFIETVFEDDSKMYFVILSPTEVAVVSGEFYYQDNPSQAYKYRNDVVIPESIAHLNTTYTVIAIAYKAFCGCNLVTSVFIPNSVKYIDSYKNYSNPYNNTYGAFQGCSNLTSINIDDNIQHIGIKAFTGCPCFSETVTIPKGVKTIGMDAFDSKSIVFNADSCVMAGGLVYPDNPTGEPTCYSAFPNMTSISFGSNVKVLPAYLYSSMNPTVADIPSSVTVLSHEAFRGCSSLERVNNLENVLELGEMAFYRCESLNAFTLNTNLTQIKYACFSRCRSLNSIEIPNSVVTIGRDAFNGSGLYSIGWGSSIDTIGISAFRSCSNLTEIVIPNTVSVIEESAFQNCSSLLTVFIGNSVTTIGANAFLYCENLIEITISNSVETIGSHAFDVDWIQTTITCMAINPPVLGEEVFGHRFIQAIRVPMASVEVYKAAEGWSQFADVIVGI